MKIRGNKKGFTLAELLIVIAIIAVLIAIAIPTFTGALNKAELAVEQANARAVHAEAMIEYLYDNSKTTFTKQYDGVSYSWSYNSGQPIVTTDGGTVYPFDIGGGLAAGS